MRIVGIVLGVVLVLAGLAVAGREVIGLSETGSYELIPLGQLWFDLHVGSLNLVQAVIERYVWPTLWDPIIVSALILPAGMTFALLGFALLLLCRRRRAKKAPPPAKTA